MTMRAVAVLLLVAGAAAASVQEKQQVTPIQKVVQMLNDMLAKAKTEKDDEAVRFASYQQFCDSTTGEKTRSISKGKEQVEKLTADIGEADADAAQASKDIGALDGDIGTWEANNKEEAFLREKKHKDFQAGYEEYTESIAAVGRATDTIKAGGAALAQTSLMELSSKSIVPEHARKLIASFIQTADPQSALLQDALEVQGKAPEAAHFESQSGGVLEMVEGLGDKFEEERDGLEKAEANEKHAFDMLSQDSTDQIEGASKQREKKASFKASRETDKANAEGDHAETSAVLAEDEKFLADLTQECEQTAVDFEQRQQTRQGEIEAINKAIEIMSSDKVSGAGDKHLPGLVQEGTAFAQIRTLSRTGTQNIAADFLRDRAAQQNSRVLSLIAVKIAEDPFKKVTKMIKDMIIKLTEEATEEAEHKGFCDTEMGTNQITRDSKTDEVASLTAEIDGLNADIAKLSEDMSALGEAIAASDAAMAEATAIRQEEKAKNTATIDDAKVAQAAVGQALTVLKEFYDKAATATALSQQSQGSEGPIHYDDRAIAILGGGAGASMLQASAPGAPATFDKKPYTGMANGGVMGMLEVIESDFARLLAETTASESEAAKTYQDFSNDSATDKAVKGQDSKNKNNEKIRKESSLQSAKKDLEGSQQELDAAVAYFEKLKPSCVDAGESYEERVASRKEEIESLGEALKILAGEDI